MHPNSISEEQVSPETGCFHGVGHPNDGHLILGKLDAFRVFASKLFVPALAAGYTCGLCIELPPLEETLEVRWPIFKPR